MRNKKVLWISQTALLISLIVLAQLLTRVIPPVLVGPVALSQLVAGSLVNLVLVVGALMAGMSSAGTAAIISPILAALLGIIPGHLPQMVPVVMAGNITIVFIMWLCGRASHGTGKKSAKVICVLGVIIGALLKSVVMWGTTAKIVVPMFHVAAKAAKTLASSVSVPQFITAVVGGILALLIMPSLRMISKTKR